MHLNSKAVEPQFYVAAEREPGDGLPAGQAGGPCKQEKMDAVRGDLESMKGFALQVDASSATADGVSRRGPLARALAFIRADARELVKPTDAVEDAAHQELTRACKDCGKMSGFRHRLNRINGAAAGADETSSSSSSSGDESGF